MDGGTIGFSHTGGLLAPFVVQAIAWLVVVVVCVLRVRRPWAWFALPGGLLGLAVATTYAADEIKVRSDLGAHDGLGAHVFDSDNIDFPGFLLDHDYFAALAWGQGVAVALLAAGLVTAVLSRRRAQPTAP